MAKSTSSGGGLSLRKKDAVDGGGGTNGGRAVIKLIEWVQTFTYGGRFAKTPSAALHVVFDVKGMSSPWDQHYSVGPSDRYEVIESGDGIRGLGKSSGLNTGSPAYVFLASVEEAVKAGELDIDELLPELDGGGHSVSGLRGQTVVLKSVTQATRGGDLREYTVIGSFVSDADGTPATPKSTNGSGKSLGPSTSAQIETKAVAAIEALIEEHTSVKVGDVPNLVYEANRKDADAKAIMQLAFKLAWLGDEARPWLFNRKKGIVTAA